FELCLDRTRVSDAGLEQLMKMPSLLILSLSGARVSAKAIALLRTTRPAVKVFWWEPNRRAAEEVLARGGKVTVRGKGQGNERQVGAVGDLPDEYFQVSRIDLAGVRGSLDSVLRELAILTDRELDRLEAVDLSGTAVSDEELKLLGSLASLKALPLREG